MTDIVETTANALLDFGCCSTHDYAERAADAVLVVVAPLLRAEGARAERERLRTEVEGWRTWAVDDGHPGGDVQSMCPKRWMLALVSREAEASDG
jgi:hypothetical protein